MNIIPKDLTKNQYLKLSVEARLAVCEAAIADALMGQDDTCDEVLAHGGLSEDRVAEIEALSRVVMHVVDGMPDPRERTPGGALALLRAASPQDLTKNQALKAQQMDFDLAALRACGIRGPIALFQDKHNASCFRDCLLNVEEEIRTHYPSYESPERTDIQLLELFMALKPNTQQIAYMHGLSDTEFRDKTYTELFSKLFLPR